MDQTQPFNILGGAQYPWIQVLRGIAVSSVVLYHISPSVFPEGYLGVDVFFTISGFVIFPRIVGSVKDKSSNPYNQFKTFYKKRFYRIIPALCATISTTTIFILIFGPLNDQIRFSRDALSALFGLGNFGALRWAGNYFSPAPNPMLHTWSLSVEEQIYLVAPLFIYAVGRFVANLKIKKIIIFSTIGWSLAFYLFPTMYSPLSKWFGIYDPASFSYYSPTSRLWEFLIGGVIGTRFGSLRVSATESRSKNQSQLIIATFLSFVIFIPIHSQNKFFPILIIAFYASLIAFTAKFKAIGNPLIKALKLLGDTSYSIYLFHFPIIYFVQSSIISIYVPNRIVRFWVTILLTLLIGITNYVCVEETYRFAPKREKIPRFTKFFSWVYRSNNGHSIIDVNLCTPTPNAPLSHRADWQCEYIELGQKLSIS